MSSFIIFYRLGPVDVKHIAGLDELFNDIIVLKRGLHVVYAAFVVASDVLSSARSYLKHDLLYDKYIVMALVYCPVLWHFRHEQVMVRL